MTLRIAIGTYEGLLYGWEFPTTVTASTACKSKLKAIFGYAAHTECLKSVALMSAKDGKTMVSGGNDEMIKIYNVNKRVEVGTLMEHHGAITCLEFFSHTHMLSGSADSSICIWRVSDWNCVHILGGHKGEVTSIAVHPSGKLAFSVARDRTLRMWNLVKGRIAYIRRLEKEASLVLMSPTGARYALCFDTELSVFNSANAEVVGAMTHAKKIHCAAFATDEFVVAGGDDCCIYVWKASGSLVAKIHHKDLTSRIRCLQVVYPNGNSELPWLVVATTTGTVQVWDMANMVFDEAAPEDANTAVEPLASTLMLSKPRVTCMSVCLATTEVRSNAPIRSKDKVVRAKPTTSKAAKASAPHVVVELDGKENKAAPTTETKKRSSSTDPKSRSKKSRR